MFRSTIPGWFMERRSASGRTGTGTRGSTLPGQASDGASASESASLVDLAGAGTTGDLIGITTISFSTIMGSYRTAESSRTANTSMPDEADSIAAAGFMEEISTAARRSMDLLRPTRNPAPAPVPSEVLITEARLEDSLPADSPASAAALMAGAASMAEVVVMVVVVTGDSSFGSHVSHKLIRRMKSCARGM